MNTDILWIDDTVLTCRRRYWLKNWFMGQVSIVLQYSMFEKLAFVLVMHHVWSIFIRLSVLLPYRNADMQFLREIYMPRIWIVAYIPLVQCFRFVVVFFFFLSMHISEYRSDLVISSQSLDTLLWTVSLFNLSSVLLTKAATRFKGGISLQSGNIFYALPFSERKVQVDKAIFTMLILHNK